MGAERRDARPDARRRCDVLVVGNYPPDRQHSMERYAVSLVEHLREAGVFADLLRPARLVGHLVRESGPLAKWFGYLDKFVLFPPVLWFVARRYGIVHIADQGNAPYRGVVRSRPTLITCHDLLAVRALLGELPHHRPSRTGMHFQRWILSHLRRMRTMVCVSDETAREVRRLLPEVATVLTIPNAIAEDYAPGDPGAARARLTALGLDPGGRYLLHVGGNQFYKNRDGAVAIFDAFVAGEGDSDLRLVLAGKQVDDKVRAAVDASPARDRIDLLVDPADADVVALYRGARALLFPSWHEGFGWPILEAQACGCPVLTSDREPMRSIAGGAAVLIDPDDPAAAARRLADALRRRDALIAGGFDNVERYRPTMIYDRYRALYDDMLRVTVARR